MTTRSRLLVIGERPEAVVVLLEAVANAEDFTISSQPNSLLMYSLKIESSLSEGERAWARAHRPWPNFRLAVNKPLSLRLGEPNF